jgi:hypothetical protein
MIFYGGITLSRASYAVDLPTIRDSCRECFSLVQYILLKVSGAQLMRIAFYSNLTISASVN